MPVIAGGLIDSALLLLRKTINDPATGGKYSSSLLVQRLGASWDKAIQDVNVALGRDPIYASWTIPFDTTTRDYLLPAMLGAVAQVGIPDSDGVLRSFMPAYGLNDIRGTNFRITPPFLQLDNLFSQPCTGRLIFTPTGMDFMHKGTCLHSAIGASTLRLNLTPTAGVFDPRPNAFVGGVVRLYDGTAPPTGYTFFPALERLITSYSAMGPDIVVNVPWGVTFTNPSTITYEVLPMVDPGLMDLAVFECARQICSLEQRFDRLRVIDGEYQRQLVTVRRQYTNRNKARTPGVGNRTDKPRDTGAGWSLPNPIGTTIVGP